MTAINLIAPLSTNQYKYLMRTPQCWLNVAEGGKRGGKNVLNTLAFAMNLELHPNKLHLVGAVSLANAKLNVFDCDGFGLINYFEGNCKEGEYKNRHALYVRTKTGEKIVLASGGGKDGDEKYIKGNSYGSAYITEANECHPKFIQEVFDRTIASKNRKIFHDLNPKGEGHFYYKDILNFHEQKQCENPDYGYNYGHFTLRDNMSLTQGQVDDVVNTYDPTSVWFLRDILGQRRQTEGLIYPNYAVAIVETEPRLYTEYQVSIDYGIQNPFAMGLYGFCNNVWYKVKEYHHSGRESKEQKTDAEYYADLETFTRGVKIRRVIVDPSATSFITLIRKSNEFHVTPAVNDVVSGISNTATAMHQGKIKINDCCAKSIEEFQLYSWDGKAADDVPVKENDHHCVSGDTIVNTVEGNIKIRDLVKKTGLVWCYDENKKEVTSSKFYDVRCTQKNAPVYEIELENGKKVIATGDHKVLTDYGWIEVCNMNTHNRMLDISLTTSIAPHFVKVKSVKMIGYQDVYNMEVENHHNFSVNGGLIMHNCDELRYFVNTNKLVIPGRTSLI